MWYYQHLLPKREFFHKLMTRMAQEVGMYPYKPDINVRNVLLHQKKGWDWYITSASHSRAGLSSKRQLKQIVATSVESINNYVAPVILYY